MKRKELTVELRDARKAWEVVNANHAEDMNDRKVVQEWGDTWYVDNDVAGEVVETLTAAGVKVTVEVE